MGSRRMGDAVGPEAVAAATVVLVRQGPGDGSDDAELLMLRRDSKLSFAGGLWVFPGGRLDPDDYPDDGDLDIAERNAAAREAGEEAGLDVAPADLVRYSHWTPPRQANKRFSTAFFVADAPAGTVVVDDGEIREHRWTTAADALAAQAAGEIELAPPTFITLIDLARRGNRTDLLASLVDHQPESFATQVAEAEGHIVALYHGDVGYGPDGDPTAPGPRHRLWLDPAGWRYQRTS